MRIVTYNIQWGKGRDGRIDLERIARTVSGADIIALQEVERNWRAQEHPDQALRLAQLLPGFDWVYGPAVDLGGAGAGSRRQIGNMTLSRLAIGSSRTWPLPARAVPGHVNDQQAMTEAVIDHGQGLRVYNLHLNYLSEAQRMEQLELAMKVIAEAPSRGGAITMPGRDGLGPEDDWIVLPGGKLPTMPEAAILLGDFNMGPGSTEYHAITAGHRLTEVLAHCGLGAGEGVTFPGGGSEPPQRLDHIFVTPSLVPAVRRAWIDGDADGSDHQPVWLEM